MKFIETEVDLYDRTLSDITGFNENTLKERVKCRINPYFITHYRQAMDSDDEPNETCIYFQGGDTIVIPKTIEEFEKLLNNI